MPKVIVLCPADMQTGGPELLHQFVNELCINNIDAKILYYPYGEHQITEAYRKYENIQLASYEEVKDCIDSTLIVPEIMTKLAHDFIANKKFIWWLSVDNYFQALPKSLTDKLKLLTKRILNHKSRHIPLSKMGEYSHLSQSEYGLLFLKKNGVKNTLKLTDYLNEVHLNNQPNLNEKENIVAYNPKKGIAFTSALIASNPAIKFVPIQNMTAAQVGELLNKSKVYIDFGEHPGKDRIPREAAMANCVIITGKRGSAANEVDVPIAPEYKFIENHEASTQIGLLINDIFVNFPTHNNKFENYRLTIKSEKECFSEQVKMFLKSL
jgi:hypothetical protein